MFNRIGSNGEYMGIFSRYLGIEGRYTGVITWVNCDIEWV